VIVGLDISLRATGFAALPADWAGDFSKVTVGHAGAPLPRDASAKARVDRIGHIVDAVGIFCETVKADRVYIEEYAFTARTSQAHALGELGGAIKLALRRLGWVAEPVAAARARTLLGKAPRKNAKGWACGLMVEMGAPREWTLDELDAVVIANWGASEANGAPIIVREATGT